ncbi:transmembrane domain-containing protein [Streptomyces sp. B8F3]|uniref:EGFR-like transmembrane domain-containing protein n=1 Tax=Streptomyces sp. B8F3 TaxID=3153573 RepID=UPI00325C7054
MTPGHGQGTGTGEAAGGTDTTAAGYLGELSARLRAAGMPQDRVAATVADVRAYLAESGTSAEAEFGPVDDFAAQLTGDGGPADPPQEAAEEWRWSAGTSVDERLLNEYGEQGWELVRVDAAGRFVSRRDKGGPQGWEYRREAVLGDRDRVEARLAPDGWEACGTWVMYAWFKRPRAASLGPAADLAAVPPPPARTVFVTWRLYAVLALVAVAVAAAGIYEALDAGAAGEGLSSASGTLAGGVVGVLAVLLPFAGYAAWRNRRRR